MSATRWRVARDPPWRAAGARASMAGAALIVVLLLAAGEMGLSALREVAKMCRSSR